MSLSLIPLALAVMLGAEPSLQAGGTAAADFKIPVEFWTEHSFHPIEYLESRHVVDPARILPREQRIALANLFRAAGHACLTKYRQSYPLSTTAPLYRLLRRQYSGLANVEGESGRIIMTDDLTDYLEGPAWVTEATAPEDGLTTAELLFSFSGVPGDFEFGIKALRGANVAHDVSSAKRRGERRLIGTFGYALEVPGVGGPTGNSRTPVGYTVVPIKGTGDAILSPAQREFQSLLRPYAEQYNKRLLAN